MTKQDKIEMDIILNRASYVLMGCAAFALMTVILLIFNT